jgi:NADPH:quinone reductase-like Zn-dependent oxidoreductase
MASYLPARKKLRYGIQELPSAGGTKARSFWRRSLDFVFGYDFFISYSWDDGRVYAQKLARLLGDQGFEVFLDRERFGSGDNWEEVGARTLRKTGQLVLVGSLSAVNSKAVIHEVEIFCSTGRHIVPIEFDRSLTWTSAEVPLARLLPAQILRIKEPTDALTRDPSEATLAEIRKTFSLIRQNTKRVGVFASIAFLLCLLTMAALWFAYTATAEKKEALL